MQQAAAAPRAVPPQKLSLSASPALEGLAVTLPLSILFAAGAGIAVSWPTLQATRRAAERAEGVLEIIEEELPDTLSALRSSGLEVGELTEEVSILAADIGRGLRGTVRLAGAAERGAAIVGKAAVELAKENAPAVRLRRFSVGDPIKT